MFKKIKDSIRVFIRKQILKKQNVFISHDCYFSGVNFKGSAIIEPYCRLIGDSIITIGDNFYSNVGCHFLGEIIIGDNVLIGPKTVIWGRDHGIEMGELIRLQPHSRQPIVIGNNVWIGANVTILKGIKIGDGAVIGAGSVVIKDIPENAIAVGNPAKVVKFRG